MSDSDEENTEMQRENKGLRRQVAALTAALKEARGLGSESEKVNPGGPVAIVCSSSEGFDMWGQAEKRNAKK